MSICLVSFASAMAVVTLNIHHRGVRGNEVPVFVRTFVLGFLSRFCFLQFDTGHNRKDRQQQEDEDDRPIRQEQQQLQPKVAGGDSYALGRTVRNSSDSSVFNCTKLDTRNLLILFPNKKSLLP